MFDLSLRFCHLLMARFLTLCPCPWAKVSLLEILTITEKVKYPNDFMQTIVFYKNISKSDPHPDSSLISEVEY